MLYTECRMSLKFNATRLPVRSSSVFGFVQAARAHDRYTIPPQPVANCARCGGITFPLNDGTNACPVCAPDLDYIPRTVRVGGGRARARTHFLIADIRFGRAALARMLRAFLGALSDDDPFVVAVLEPRVVVLHVRGGVPSLYLFGDGDDIAAPRYFAARRCDAADSDELAAALCSACSVFGGAQSAEFDLLRPLKFVLAQADGDPFAAYFMLAGDSVPLPAERIDAAGRSIAKQNGVVHFGAYRDFRRLTGIASHNFGCVFRIGDDFTQMFKKLYSLSKQCKLEVVVPRAFEIVKSSGAVGSVRETEFFKLISFDMSSGCACRFALNYNMSDDLRKKNLNVLELTQNDDGEFITLHRFSVASSQEEFDESLNTQITNSIILKGFISDVLKESWKGVDWDVIMYKIRNSSHEKVIQASNLVDISGDQDKSILKLYYDMHCLSTNLTNKLIKIQNGYVLISPPNLLIYTDKQTPVDIDEVFESEWPLNVVYTNNFDDFCETCNHFNLSPNKL